MSSILTAKALSPVHQFAGRKWSYDFRVITNRFPEKICQKVAGNIAQQYSLLTKNWDSDRNSEWLCRIYIAAKMIMNATLHLQSLNYSEEKNLRVVVPYLRYYSVLSVMRGLVLTLPEQLWNNGQLPTISHNTIINIAFDFIAKFDSNLSTELKNKVLKLKAYRELISYSAPTKGDSAVCAEIDVVWLCTLLAELAQYNSEILESSIFKNAPKETFVFKNSYITELSSYTIGGFEFFDSEDSYRLGYLSRKWPVAPNIHHIMTEGHTEDFFGAWYDEEEVEGNFCTGSPCDWQSIFDIP